MSFNDIKYKYKYKEISVILWEILIIILKNIKFRNIFLINYYRKIVINLISQIMIGVTLGPAVFRILCIPLKLFTSTPIWISIAYAVLCVGESIYMRIQVIKYNKNNNSASYNNIKAMLIVSNVFNLFCCYICFKAFCTWTLVIFFVAALAFLQEKKLTIISLIINFSITAVYLFLNFRSFMSSLKPVEELIMLGLSFSMYIIYIVLDIYLVNNTLSNTGNVIANNSLDKLSLTLRGVKEIIPKLDDASNTLLSTSQNESAVTEELSAISDTLMK